MPEDILFDLNAFGPRGVELAQLAATDEAAGRVETVSGTVSVRRLSGEVDTLNVGDEIFMGDTLEVSNDGSLGVIFADDTTLALGEGAQMIIDEMVYDPAGESGSLALTVADGVFSFVSGQISKTGDDAMVINTPVATIGIRGTKGAGEAGPEGENNQITLLPEDDGQVGEIVVRNDAGVQVLNQPGQSVAMESRFEAPPPPTVMSGAEIEAAYSTALTALPPPPRRRADATNDNGDPLAEEGVPVDGDPDAVPEEGAEELAEGEDGVDPELAAEEEVLEEEEPLEEGEGPVDGEFGEQPGMFADVGGPLGDDQVGDPVEDGTNDGDLIGGSGEDALFTGDGFGGTVGEDDGGLGFEDLGLTDPSDLLGGDGSEEDFQDELTVIGEDETDPLIEEEVVEETTTAPASLNTVTGTSALEQVLGTSGDDEINALDGDDWVLGDAGDDIIYGGGGADVIYGDTPIIGRISTDGNGMEISAASEMDYNDYNLTSSNDSQIAFYTSHGLDAADTNASTDAYVKNLSDGSVTWVSHKADGTASNGSVINVQMSGDGAYVFFMSSATDLAVTSSSSDYQLYRLHLATETLEKVSEVSGVEGDAPVSNYSVSDDGNLIAFSSTSTNFDANDTTAALDIFVKDMTADTVTLVSKEVTSGTSDGSLTSYGPSISGDGSYIVYTSSADDLVSGDANALTDVFVYDVSGQTNSYVSISTASAQSDGGSGAHDVSSDGRYIVFESAGTNLDDTLTDDADSNTDIFLRDTVAGTTTKVTDDYSNGDSDGSSYAPSVSDDGRYVVFHSSATDLMSHTDTTGSANDIYIKDMTTGEVRAVNKPFGSDPSSVDSHNAHISADGKMIMFISGDSLVPGDSNGTHDIFIAANPFQTDSGGGADIIDGGDGDDTIWGGTGDDLLTGGAGADIFYFQYNDGADSITDFTTGEDKIALDTTTFEFTPTTAGTFNFEEIAGTYDGTNASASSNVILDGNGDLYVDTNGQTAGGYSLVANVGDATVVASDIDEVN